MPKKKRRCEHPYEEYDSKKGFHGFKPCPHDCFCTGKHPWKDEEIGCCIFHAPINNKKDHIERFWKQFNNLIAKATEHTEDAKNEEEKKNVWLECSGFVFPVIRDLFGKREFPFSVNMRSAQFSGVVSFADAHFSGDADFSCALFLGDAYFISAQFSGAADLLFAQFLGETRFTWAEFLGTADFTGAHFAGEVDLSFVKLKEYFTFRFASVTGKVRFNETEFFKDADFRNVSTDKREVEGEDLGPGTVVFGHTYFHLPDRVPIGGKAESPDPNYTFKTDLSRWSFCGTNIEKIRFIEPCWPEEKTRRGRKRTLDEERAEKGNINWREAGEVYRKLRKNFEDNLAYEAAGDFHVGQMECRLRDRNRKPWDRALTFAYKLISGYGESIGRPVKWLLGTAVLFGLLSLFHGFPTVDGSGVNWDIDLSKAFDGTEKVVDIEPVVSFTARTAVSFGIPGQNDTTLYCDDRLYLLTCAWKILAVVFVTFFILALRRRFRR